MKNFKYETENNKLIITGYAGTDSNLNIPSEIDGIPVTGIDNYAFYLSEFINVTIPDTVTSIGSHAFDGCNRLRAINVDSNNTNYSSTDGVLFNKNKTKLIRYPIGDDHIQYNIPDSVTSIGDYAFNESCPTILEIHAGVKSIGRHAFDGYYCGTRHIYYEGGHEQQFDMCIDKTDECTNNLRIYYVHRNYVYTILDDSDGIIITDYTGSSTDISIPSEIDGKPVTAIGSCAFEDCKSLTNITIPDSITSIGADAFSYCSSLTSIAMPNSVTSIGSHAFYHCTGLKSVTIPDSVTSIGDYAFYECTSLTSVTIPDSVTIIDNYTFCYCTSLKSVTIPDGVISIGSYAFNDCIGLISVTIPDSVKFIGKGAFYGCDALKNVVIPNNVKYIGDYAFYCTGLTGGVLNHSLFLGRGNEQLK